MTLYEFNQMGMNAFEEYTQKDFDEAKQKFKDFYQKNKDSKYFMILNKEQSYYTLFRIKSSEVMVNVLEKMFDETFECLKFFGNVIDIDISEEKDRIEIWTKAEDENATMFLLFPYDAGVIEI